MQLLNPSAGSNCEMDVSSVLTSLHFGSKVNNGARSVTTSVRSNKNVSRADFTAVLSCNSLICLFV